MNVEEKRALKVEDLRKLSKKDLLEKKNLIEQDLANMRFQLATRQLDDTSRVRLLKKGIARINQIIRHQEIEEKKPAGAK
jgi:large subunit ribosomal protein L29